MRVLVAASAWFPDYAGGTERVVRATAEALAARDHDVTVIVPRATNEPEISIVNGVKVHRVIRRSILPLTITDVYQMRRAIRLIPSDDFDLVLAHAAVYAVAALVARSHKPFAFVFHASAFRESRQRRSQGLQPLAWSRAFALEPLLFAFERLALRLAPRILVLSAFSRELVLDIDQRAEPRVEIVGGGVDVRSFTPAHDRSALRRDLGIPEGKTVLVTARRLVSRTGVAMLLDAFRELDTGRHDIELVIIGDGELRPHLERQRNRLALGEAVRFLGSVPDAELRNWYRAADLFILPTIAYEGFGMVTAEALACGTPVVATPVGATSEILDPLDQDLMADEVSARSLVAAIERALLRTSSAFRDDCYEYARDRLAWDVVIGRWESALRELQAISE